MTLLALAAAWLAGVFLALRFQVPPPAVGLFAASALLLLALLLSLRRSPLPALLLAVGLLGVLRVEAFAENGASALAAYHGRPSQVRGVVASDPEPAGAATRLRFRVDSVRWDDQWVDASGDALVTLWETPELARQRERPYYRYGDRLLLHGTLEAPPALEGFDYPTYLARQGIGSAMSFPEAALLDEGQGLAFHRWLYDARRSIAQAISRAVPEPQASLGQALLLGLREDLPDELINDFQATGTSHVLAISGLNVSILVGLSVAASQAALGRRRQLYLILPFALTWLYALISGMSPSVARAAIMGSVYLAALGLGRPRSALPALGLAAALMVALNPNVLWSVSFQLSFAAMAGIALLAEPLSQRLRWLYASRLGSESLARAALTGASAAVAMTVAATLATAPIIALYFQQVSLVGLPANLLALPAVPAILVAQAAVGLAGLLSSGVAQPLGWLAWLATAYLSGVVGLVARFPGASVETSQVAPLLVWAYYGVFVLLVFKVHLVRVGRKWLTTATKLTPSWPLAGRGVPRLALGAVVSLAALLWIAALSVPDARLRVAFIDVGQGDAILITTPSGRQVLVDGGPDPMLAVGFLGSHMPFRDRTIDLVALTHPHGDHVNGLVEVLRRYKVRRVLERETEHEGAPYQAWRRAVAGEGADVIQAQAGQVIAMGDGVFIQVLNPPARLLQGTSSDLDNASVALRVAYGNVSFLLTGDMFGEAEAALLATGAPIDSDVLKVAHHGSRNSSSAAFLDAVSPVAAVISAGADNPFGHPHPEVVEALRRRLPENRLFLTRDRGAIEFVTDGRRLEVKTRR